MKAAETIAVNKAIAKSALELAREKLSVGEHHVDVTIHIKGKIVVGHDYEANDTCSLPNMEIITMLMSMLNPTTQKTAIELIRKRMMNKNDPEFHDIIRKHGSKFKKTFTKIQQELIAKMDRIKKSGPVTATLELEEV